MPKPLIVPEEEMLSYMGESSGNYEITQTHRAVEDYIQGSFCNRTFPQTSYTMERYDGRGVPLLHLKQFPVLYVDRLVIGAEDAIKIKNTSTYTYATVAVTATGLRLTKDGSTDSSILFATYTTMSTVVSAINGLGSGWNAELSLSGYSSINSNLLFKRPGADAIDNNYVYLQMPDPDGGQDEYELYEDSGMIRKSYGVFPKGHNNVFVNYTAGYTNQDMPEDLKYAVKLILKYLYQRSEEDALGVKSYNLGRIGLAFEDGSMPKEAIDILFRYKRFSGWHLK